MVHFDYCCSFVATILFTLLTQFKFALSTQQLNEVKHENIFSLIDKQNHRIQLIELRNVKRDKEMNFLKMENSEIRKQMDQMNDRLNEVGLLLHSDIKTFKTDNTADDVPLIPNNHHNKDKRIARMIPTSLLFNVTKNTEPISVPSNCSDLNNIGFTLSGIYLVQRKDPDNNNEINAVFCNFNPFETSTNLSIPETNFGRFNMKSGPGFFFFVQGIGSGQFQTDKNGVIRFEKERLNVGKAMNPSTGVFTAPKSGIYYFSFSITKKASGLPETIFIHLRLNGKKIGLSPVGLGFFAGPATIQSTLQLKKGDRVDLWKAKGGSLAGSPDSEPLHHFTGWLLDAYEEQ